MSKNNNVNPGQYKVAGRERSGKEIVPSEHKAAESVKAHELKAQRRRQSNKRERSAPNK